MTVRYTITTRCSIWRSTMRYDQRRHMSLIGTQEELWFITAYHLISLSAPDGNHIGVTAAMTCTCGGLLPPIGVLAEVIRRMTGQLTADGVTVDSTWFGLNCRRFSWFPIRCSPSCSTTTSTTGHWCNTGHAATVCQQPTRCAERWSDHPICPRWIIQRLSKQMNSSYRWRTSCHDVLYLLPWC